MDIPKEFTTKLMMQGVHAKTISVAYKIYQVLCDKKEGVVMSKNSIKIIAGIGDGTNKSFDKATLSLLQAEIINDSWEVIWKI